MWLVQVYFVLVKVTRKVKRFLGKVEGLFGSVAVVKVKQWRLILETLHVSHIPLLSS